MLGNVPEVLFWMKSLNTIESFCVSLCCLKERCFGSNSWVLSVLSLSFMSGLHTQKVWTNSNILQELGVYEGIGERHWSRQIGNSSAGFVGSSAYIFQTITVPVAWDWLRVKEKFTFLGKAVYLLQSRSCEKATEGDPSFLAVLILEDQRAEMVKWQHTIWPR